ncbi:adenosine deaminase [Microbacterium sp. cf332]|uniref:adenosine deaminase n=1 Tax=Microbacterium sp. cf332 TaxID=1761804 RepID=UPI00088D1E68|nr:adenosine deaminase [Microbacterium sp. cf332]SDQ57672.1 adenosine deaminase [Microbacterium sp. cf332]
MTLPKTELHVHIEGTLEPELAFALAGRNRVDLPFPDVDALRAAYDFDDLQSFLDLYYATMAVLLTERDFTDLTVAYLERAAGQGLAHAEVFFDPQAHTSRGVDLAAVIDGISAGLEIGRERWGVSSALILCFLRNLPAESAMQTLEQAMSIRADAIDGVGLDSSEVGFPPSLFDAVFARAAQLGLRKVAHAGEEAPPAYILEALDVLGVERIDHGVQAVVDPALLSRLADERTPLTVCPLSNVRLRVVDDLAQHPLRAFLEAGVLVTVNSDDPAYFGGYVGDNYVAVRDALALTDAQLAHLARNGVEASWATAERKAELHAAIDAWESDGRPA